MAQFQQNKMINGGLNSDFDYDLVPAGDYVDASNISTYGGVSNIFGNASIQLKDFNGTTDFALTTSHTIVGSAPNTLRDSIIYLIAEASGKDLLTEYNQQTNVAKVIVRCGTGGNAELGTLNLASTTQVLNACVINRSDTDEEGDLLFWLDKDNTPRKINLRKARTGLYGTTILADYTTVAKKPPLLSPSSVTFAKVTSGSLNIQNKAYQFAYRYIYDDYEKSVFSPLSNVLVPYYIFNETNVIPLDNANGYNAITMGITAGAGNVKNIEIIYREYYEGIWSNFYSIDTVNNTTSTYTFTDTGQRIPLDNSEAPDVLQFDYVPLKAKAQEVVNGNVITYGNFTEGYNKTTIDATPAVYSSMYAAKNQMFIDGAINPQSSMFLNPGGRYKVGVIYLDKYGRNSGVFTNNTMIVNVPHQQWDLPTNPNTRKVFLPSIKIDSDAPSWADSFRLAITEDNNYESEVITDVIDFRYAYLASALGETCSLSKITFPAQANGGADSTLPMFLEYNTGNTLKLTYSNCDTNAAVTAYYPNSSTSFDLKYRNKLISDPSRLIFEYKKLTSAVQGTDYTITVNSAGGSATTIPASNFQFYSGGPGNIMTVWYTGSVDISNFTFYYAANTINGRVPSSGYISTTVTGPVLAHTNFNVTVYPTNATPTGGYFADATANPTNPNITITNTSGQILYVYINTTKYTIAIGGTLTTDVPSGYIVTAFKYSTITGSTSNSDITISVSDGAIVPGSDTVVPKQLIARISNLGYTYQAGDVISFVFDYYKYKTSSGQYNGSGVNEQVYKIKDLLLDPTFIKTDGTSVDLVGNWLQLDETAKSFLDSSGDTSSTTQIIGLRAKILRQKKTSSESELFYEIPQTYSVSSYTKGTVIQMSMAGDCIFKSDLVTLEGDGAAGSATEIGGKNNTVQRTFYSSVPTKNYMLSGDKLSPLFLAKIYKNGRPGIEDKQARQREFPSTIRWSQNLEFNSNVNGLNRFLYLDFKDLDGSFGAIKRLSVRDRMLRAWQEDKVGALPIYQSIITNAAGGTDLTLSTELFNNVQYYAGNYSIGNAVGSLISDSYADYFIDDIRKAVCRLGQEGITPISITNNMNYWASNNIGYKSTYTAGYDSANRLAIFSSTNGSANWTIVFSERTDRFESFYSYYPKSIISINNKLYTTDSRGGFWEHKSSVAYCNFYGTQYDAKIKVLLNEQPMVKKHFLTISESGNAMWYASYVKGAANSTASSIPYTYFRNQEAFFNAPFLRDGGVLTPTAGKPIRGNWCVLELSSLTPSNYVTLLMFKYTYNESKIN